jgi:hypothetical protein
MTSDQHVLTDASIEAALHRRAPHGPDGALLVAIAAEASRTPQRRALPRWAGWAAERHRLATAAIALTAAGGLIALALSGIGGRREEAVVPSAAPASLPAVAVPSSQASLVPTASDAGTDCTTDRIVVEVPAGPVDQQRALDLSSIRGRATYIRSMSVPTWPLPTGGAGPSGERAGVWTTDQGGVSRPVTTIGGPGVDWARLADVTPDGSVAVLIIGKISPSGASPECTDVYAVPLDGGVPERLTASGRGDVVTAAAAASDGSVALIRWTQAVFGGGWQVAMAGTQRHPWQDIPCGNFSSYARVVARTEGPEGRLAVACDGSVVVVDLDTWTIRQVPTEGLPGALAWASPEALRVASASASGLHLRTLLRVSGSASARDWPRDSAPIDWVEGPQAMSFSPDGRWLLAEGYPAGGGVDSETMYLVPTAGGSPEPILDSTQLEASWAPDGSLLYLDRGDRLTLMRLDPSTGKRAVVAEVSATAYDGYTVPVVTAWP